MTPMVIPGKIRSVNVVVVAVVVVAVVVQYDVTVDIFSPHWHNRAYSNLLV